MKSMSLSADKIADLRVKHLEMIQTVISRMAGYGATFKGLCVTLTTAVCGLGITMHRPFVVLLAIFPVIAFAALDTHSLRVERRFRLVYEAIRQQAWDVVPDFQINPAVAPIVRLSNAAGSWAIVGFYGPLYFGVCAVAVIGNFFDVFR